MRQNHGPTLPSAPWRAGIIAESPAMQELLYLVAKLAPTTIPVLILGPTGSGKEVLARAVHGASERPGTFVAVNCATLPLTLAESELFGHVKGAFTGALADQPGLFAQAHQGTLFLDEVGELDLLVQGKLLRVLDEHAVRSVGATRWAAVDCRVMAATNRDLAALVATGQFREDLYHRISGITLTIPPLADRPEDIPPLIHHFLAQVSGERSPPELAPGLAEELATRPWRGNVRELRQVIWRAVVLGGRRLSTRDFAPQRAVPRARPPQFADWLAGKRFKEIEREVLAWALEHYQGITPAAIALGLPKSTFYERVRILKLSLPKAPRRSSRTNQRSPSPDQAPPAPAAGVPSPAAASPVTQGETDDHLGKLWRDSGEGIP